MAILHDGVMRQTTAEDIVNYLEANGRQGSRRLDCMAWDALGYQLITPEDHSDGWPTWVNSAGVLSHESVPEFSKDLTATLNEVVKRRRWPSEFMEQLTQILSEDDSLTPSEYVRVLPIAAIPLCVMRFA